MMVNNKVSKTMQIVIMDNYETIQIRIYLARRSMATYIVLILKKHIITKTKKKLAGLQSE